MYPTDRCDTLVAKAALCVRRLTVFEGIVPRAGTWTAGCQRQADGK